MGFQSLPQAPMYPRVLGDVLLRLQQTGEFQINDDSQDTDSDDGTDYDELVERDNHEEGEDDASQCRIWLER